MSDDARYTEFLKEARNMKSIPSHDHVVKCIGLSLTVDQAYVVLEVDYKNMISLFLFLIIFAFLSFVMAVLRVELTTISCQIKSCVRSVCRLQRAWRISQSTT